jgi:GTP pyrophosphokinase/guanosine-3',5'-bis(diphosphate) 3'-pyrophosphohydrolase
MQVEWAEELTRAFGTSILVLVSNGKGVLAQVAAAISHAEADIMHLDMGEERPTESAELKLLISVRDRLNLADVLRTLRRSPTVLRVARVKP